MEHGITQKLGRFLFGEPPCRDFHARSVERSEIRPRETAATAKERTILNLQRAIFLEEIMKRAMVLLIVAATAGWAIHKVEESIHGGVIKVEKWVSSFGEDDVKAAEKRLEAAVADFDKSRMER
ncbi:MAG: hypothetical protein Q8O25_08285 [Sulfurisoma sp.]|nr:hypothetical protein [Sulfurisoma sp.]